MEEGYFDQQAVCRAPVLWSFNTTVLFWNKKCFHVVLFCFLFMMQHPFNAAVKSSINRGGVNLNRQTDEMDKQTRGQTDGPTERQTQGRILRAKKQILNGNPKTKLVEPICSSVACVCVCVCVCVATERERWNTLVCMYFRRKTINRIF